MLSRSSDIFCIVPLLSKSLFEANTLRKQTILLFYLVSSYLNILNNLRRHLALGVLKYCLSAPVNLKKLSSV